MNKQIINTAIAPKAIGPYSQGIATENFIFFSGQIAIDSSTGKLKGNNITEQTRQVLKNINALLSSQGLNFANVVKTTVFVTDMSEFSEVNAVYGEYFTSEPPARSCVAVAALPLGALVEIEVIAVK